MRNPSGICKCGCGQPTARVLQKDQKRHGYEDGGFRDFVHGHHRRGVKHTHEARSKMSEAISSHFEKNPSHWLGKHHSEETKARMSEQQRGPLHHRWAGDRVVTQEGYVLIYVGHAHPMAIKYGRALEHRLVMAEHLGRPLLPTEDVHHINGDKGDNRIENLKLIDHGLHSSTQRRRIHGAAIRGLLAQGKSPEEVATYLHMSPETVARYTKEFI